jgi:hypothetical protein
MGAWEVKLRITNFELQDRTAAMLRGCGFDLVNVSRKSTACYYRFPGRFGLLRVAIHKKHEKNDPLSGEPVLISINCQGFMPSPTDWKFEITEAKIESDVARAVGLYMIRSRPMAAVDRFNEAIRCPLPLASSAA